MLDAGEDCRVADLEAVQVQDRQNRPVRDRIEEFVGLPGGRQGARFGFAVADDAGDNEPRIVECGAEGVAQRISEFAALVNGAGRRRGDMARNAARKGELFEEPFHPGFVLADVGIDLAVAALEIGVGDQRRAAVAGTGDVDHVEIMQSDRPVQMDVDEILPGRRSPMPDHKRLDMRQRERLAQHRICVEVDLTHREIVGGAPVRVEQPQFVRIQDSLPASRWRRRGRACLAVKRERSLSLCLSLCHENGFQCSTGLSNVGAALSDPLGRGIDRSAFSMISRKGFMMSIGMGKTTVEFCSAPISVNVWR